MQSAQFQLHAEIEQRHWWFVARRQILAEVIAAVLPAGQGETIVEVGCGTGANLAALAGGYRCVGIDTSAEAIALARHRFEHIQFIHGLAPRDLGAVIERTRLVLVADVLEHVADDFSLLSDLLAAARPGTYFLLTVPADRRLWSEHDTAFGHYRRYDRERLRRVWQGLAVREIFTSYFNTRLYGVVRAVRAISQWRGQTRGAAGTDFVVPQALTNRLLTNCFAGERHRLARLARGLQARPYRRGVSLMALIERQAAPIDLRIRPAEVPPDEHDPACRLAAAAV